MPSPPRERRGEPDASPEASPPTGPSLSLATVTRVTRRSRPAAGVGGSASVAGTSVSRRTKKSLASTSGGAAAATDLADQYKEVMTEPPLTHLLGPPSRQRQVAMAAVPGLIAVGGAFGCAIFSTHVRPPFPLAAIHRAGPSDSPIAALHLDPFAPHHRYLASVRRDGSVSVVSTRAGYTFSVDHAHHCPRNVVAATWSMALHAPRDALPLGDETCESDASGKDSPAQQPERAPLAANTPRVFVTLGSDGALAVLDPTTHASYVVGRVPPAAAVVGAASEESARAAEVTSSVPIGWREMALVAYRDPTTSNRIGVNIVLAADVEHPSSAVDDDGAAADTVETSHVVAVIRCRRSGFGHRLLPPEDPSALPSPSSCIAPTFTDPLDDPGNAAAPLGDAEFAAPPTASSSNPDVEAWAHDRMVALVPHVICCASATSTDAQPLQRAGSFSASNIASPATPGSSDGRNSAFGLGCYPFSSGAVVVSRERAGRFWFVDGARGRLASSATARTGGGTETAYNSRGGSSAVMPSLQLDVRDAEAEAEADEDATTETSFPASAVAAPPFLRSGTLRRHLVVQRGPAIGREVRLAVVHTPSDALSSWLVESNTWDGVPLPRGIADPSRVKAVVAGTAPLRLSDHDAPFASASPRRDVDAPTHPTTPVLLCATPEGNISLLEMPGGIAVTPLLEAILRERYTGAAPVAKPPPPDLVAAASVAKPKVAKSLLRSSVGDEMAHAARWFGSKAKNASAAMAAAVAASSAAAAAAGYPVSPSRSQRTSYSDLSELGSRVSSPRLAGASATAFPSTSSHFDPMTATTPPRRQRAVLVYTGAGGNTTTTNTTTTHTGTNTDSNDGSTPLASACDSPAQRRRRVSARAVTVNGNRPLLAMDDSDSDREHTDGSQATPPASATTVPPREDDGAGSSDALREQHSAAYGAADAVGGDDLERELEALRWAGAIEAAQGDEADERAAIQDAERRAWTSDIAGAHEVAMDRREELRRAASEMRRAQAGTLSAAAIVMRREALHRALRPAEDAMADGEGVTREFLAAISSSARAKSHQRHGSDVADEHRPAEEPTVWLAPNPKRPQRLAPSPALAAVMARDRKLFDMAQLRLALAEERAAASPKVLVTTIVYEDWRRASADEPWAPCPVQFTLATDGTAVDMAQLTREADASRAGMRNKALSLGLSQAVVDTIGVWRADPWRYAHRWPANATEAADSTFWSDPTSETLAGEASSSSLLARAGSMSSPSFAGAAAEAPTRVLKVRRRVWRTVDVDPKPAAALGEVRRAHRSKLEGLARSLDLPPADAYL